MEKGMASDRVDGEMAAGAAGVPTEQSAGASPPKAGPSDAARQDAPSASAASSGAMESSPYGNPAAVSEAAPSPSTAAAGAMASDPYGQPEAAAEDEPAPVPEDAPTGARKYIKPPPFNPPQEKPQTGDPFKSADVDEVIL